MTHHNIPSNANFWSAENIERLHSDGVAEQTDSTSPAMIHTLFAHATDIHHPVEQAKALLQLQQTQSHPHLAHLAHALALLIKNAQASTTQYEQQVHDGEEMIRLWELFRYAALTSEAHYLSQLASIANLHSIQPHSPVSLFASACFQAAEVAIATPNAERFAVIRELEQELAKDAIQTLQQETKETPDTTKTLTELASKKRRLSWIADSLHTSTTLVAENITAKSADQTKPDQTTQSVAPSSTYKV